MAVEHVQYRGAFGVQFFYHHAIVFGVEPLEGEADERMVYHRSGCARAGEQANSLESAEIRAVSWPDFCLGADNEHARGAIESVTYEEGVRARNLPALCLARAPAMLGRRGLVAGVDSAGNACEGYHSLSKNCGRCTSR